MEPLPEPVDRDAVLARALHKLRWSADNGEWSATLTPLECAVVLEWAAKANTVLVGQGEPPEEIIYIEPYVKRLPKP